MMKKTLSAALFCSAITLFAAGNLLPNGSFEEMNAKKMPKHWNIYKNVKIVSDAANGKNAVHINNSRIASHQFRIQPGKYILKLKAKKMNKAWCGYSFICTDKTNKQIKSKTLNGYYGMKAANPDWTQFEFAIEFPANMIGRTYLVLGVQGGDVFIDDVQLLKVRPEKK